MTARHEMLLQNGERGEMPLLPVWPRGWDLSFKLHAAQNTIVEGLYRSGKLQQFKVALESRRKDLVIGR